MMFRRPNELLPPGELQWPITWRWHMMGADGGCNQEFSVNAPELVDDPVASRKLGLIVWQHAIAPAITSSADLVLQETVCWAASITPAPVPVTELRGRRSGGTRGRGHAGVIVMHTGHQDGFSRRRLFLPWMPTAWSSDGMLTVAGAEGLQELGRGLYLGLADVFEAHSATWLLAYVFPPDPSAPAFPGVGFRRVTNLRVCQYTERAPDPSFAGWP